MDFEFSAAKEAGKPRKAWIALIDSLLMPGLGQIYNGQFRKGLSFYLAIAISTLLLALLTFTLPLYLLAVLYLFPLVMQVWSTVDAFRTARRLNNFQPKRYNRWFFYIGIYLLVAVIVELVVTGYIKEEIVQAYKIPAASMIPTLLVGDHILADKSIDSVSRGDIIVFEFPDDEGKDNPRDFVKRVVGLPGDKIEIRNKQLFVNDQLEAETYAEHRDTQTIPAEVGPRDEMAPITVPEGMYFVLGDNRDYSFDSRFWGFVAADKVRGRAVKIYWSWDKKESAVRWERIGQIVN